MNRNWKRELFLDRQFDASALKIDGVGLRSTVDEVDYFDITDIYVDKKGSGKLRFKDRIELLKKGKGWMHLATGVSFGIKKGIVKQLKLSTHYLQDKKTSRADLLKVFGLPDTELVDDICYSALDYNIDANVMVYRNKEIYAFLDPKTDKLKELHFGEFDESIYGKK